MGTEPRPSVRSSSPSSRAAAPWRWRGRSGSATAATWTRSRRLEVDFVTGDALFQEAYGLVQVSTSLSDPATRTRELRACTCAMARFGLDEATVVTMDEQEEAAVAEGTVHVVPAWKWLLD